MMSPIQVIPKTTIITVDMNDKDELIPIRIQSRWRVCINYKKLNSATINCHSPLPLLDQMLERLAGTAFYCFLNGYSCYAQIPVALEDQEKATFMLSLSRVTNLTTTSIIKYFL